jgi:ESF2/ABP1 family protein
VALPEEEVAPEHAEEEEEQAEQEAPVEEEQKNEEGDDDVDGDDDEGEKVRKENGVEDPSDDPHEAAENEGSEQTGEAAPDEDDGLEDGAEEVPRKRKPGVVYMSRIPPFMKPAQLRHILSKYGELNRLYLAPEPESKRKARKKAGGNSKLNFTEGWIEFKKKKDAKLVALALNNTIMGGNKRLYYHDDIWNLKYLPGFKWHHLTEKVAYENRIREQRLRTQVAQAKRQNAIYLDNVEKSHIKQKIEERRKRQASALQVAAGDATEAAGAPSKEGKRQKKAAAAGGDPNDWD